MYTYSEQGRLVTYYMIFQETPEGTVATHPMYIVESRDVAVAFCENHSGFYFTEAFSIIDYDEK